MEEQDFLVDCTGKGEKETKKLLDTLHVIIKNEKLILSGAMTVAIYIRGEKPSQEYIEEQKKNKASEEDIDILMTLERIEKMLNIRFKYNPNTSELSYWNIKPENIPAKCFGFTTKNPDYMHMVLKGEIEKELEGFKVNDELKHVIQIGEKTLDRFLEEVKKAYQEEDKPKPDFLVESLAIVTGDMLVEGDFRVPHPEHKTEVQTLKDLKYVLMNIPDEELDKLGVAADGEGEKVGLLIWGEDAGEAYEHWGKLTKKYPGVDKIQAWIGNIVHEAKRYYEEDETVFERSEPISSEEPLKK